MKHNKQMNEMIDRIINSDEIGVDDLLADSMAIKDGINELLAEVERLQKRNEWLEEVVALLQEDGIDLSMECYPLWEGEEE